MGYLHRTVRWIARIGYGARGLVYLAVGSITWQAATELEEVRDVRGAMRSINTEPGGRVLLIALAAGLAAYAIWRTVQSLLDVDRHGYGARGLAVRAGLLVSAALHSSLAWACVQIALSLGGHDSKPVQHAVARTLEWPYGRVVVVAGGVIVAGAGIAHLHKAATGGFRRWFDAPAWAMLWIDPVSRVGLTARGLLFLGVAAFVSYSALTLDASDARGVEGVLIWVQERLYGRIMLGALAAGLFAFGCYSIIEAFVRRVGLRPAAIAH